MFKSIFYKEWIKSRWGLIGTTAIAMAVVLYLFTAAENRMTVLGAKIYTLKIINDTPQIIYYSFMRYMPLLIALAVGISQYVPEVTAKRIRLTLHLPAQNSRLVSYMACYGIIVITVSYAVLLSVFLYKNITLFPAQITQPVMISMLPWFIAGYVAYNFIAMTAMEPNKWRQIAYAAIGYLVIVPFLSPIEMHGANPELLWISAIMAIASFPLVIYSAHRFSKGEI